MIVAFVPNLMDRSRFGSQTTFVASAAELADLQPTVIFVDLDRCEHPQDFRIDGAKVTGFGSHINTDVHEAAAALGYDVVLARSQFFRRLPDLVAEATP